MLSSRSWIIFIPPVVWGLSFVVQRNATSIIEPFGFNAARYLVAALVVIPFFRLGQSDTNVSLLKKIYFGTLTGILLYGGSAFQQIGLELTTAGKSAFITGLYVIWIPCLARLLGQKIEKSVWLGGCIALVGLYLLSGLESGDLNRGDVMTFLGSICWAGHVLMVERCAKSLNSYKFCALQFIACSILSFFTSLQVEQVTSEQLQMSIWGILYTGAISVGIGHTLQTIGQRYVSSSKAALILSTEAVFGALFGWVFLSEILSPVAMLGCVLMFLGIVISLNLQIRKQATA